MADDAAKGENDRAANGDGAQPEGGGSRAEGDAIPDAAVVKIVSATADEPSGVKVEAPTTAASTAMAAATSIASATTASASATAILAASATVAAAAPSTTAASTEVA